MPSTASSPSMRAQSCSLWYLRSSGYVSVTAKLGTLLSLVDRAFDDSPTARPAADVDRDLHVRRCSLRREVRKPDAAVEHRRVRSGCDLAATIDGHPVSRHGLLLHHERNELARRAARLDLAELVRTGELLVERAGPREPRRDRVR